MIVRDCPGLWEITKFVLVNEYLRYRFVEIRERLYGIALFPRVVSKALFAKRLGTWVQVCII